MGRVGDDKLCGEERAEKEKKNKKLQKFGLDAADSIRISRFIWTCPYRNNKMSSPAQFRGSDELENIQSYLHLNLSENRP